MRYFFFDLETTSADASSAHIVQIAFITKDAKHKENNGITGNYIINPGVHIDQGASQVHGFTDEIVKDEKRFKDYAQTLFPLMDGAIWAGYNNTKFDNIIIRNEFAIAGLKTPSCAGVIDCYKLFTYHEGRSKQKGTRTLKAAHKFYCTYDYDNAHDALADVKATMNVYRHQLDYYKITEDDALKICRKKDYSLDRRGFFKFDPQTRQAIVAIGKHAGKPIERVPAGYLKWIADSDSFGADTKKIALDALSGYYPVYVE